MEQIVFFVDIWKIIIKKLMITKHFVKIALYITALACMLSCDDDYPTVGGSILPGGDNIYLYADQISLTAKTVSIGSDLFVTTNNAILGSIYDPVFGRVQSDFLAQLFVARTNFDSGYKGINDVRIDSVKMQFVYLNGGLVGDKSAPMGVSIYELNKDLETEDEKADYYLSVNPGDYCDKSQLWGQRFFIDNDLPSIENNAGKLLEIDVKKSVGERILNRLKQDSLEHKKETILFDTNEFKKFIKGIYVTCTFNDKSLIKFSDANASIYLNVYYSYNIKNAAGTADSLISKYLPFPLGAQALQLNSVQNTKFEDLEISKNLKSDRNYIKALSGIVTEYTIPLKEIREKGIKKTGQEKFALSSALFNFVGMTEVEADLKLTDRPSNLLFINSDSIQNYFFEGKVPNGITEWTVSRYFYQSGNAAVTNNTYYFNTGRYEGARTDNIALLISYYLINHPELDEVKYVLIPIDVVSTQDSSGNYAISSVGNSFLPSAAILRTGPDYLKVPLIFGQFATERK